MYCFILCKQRKVLLCGLAIYIVLLVQLLNSLHKIDSSSHIHLWTQFPLTSTAPDGTESGVVTVGSKPSVTLKLTGTESGVVRVGSKQSVILTNSSHEVLTTLSSPSSLLYWPNDQQWTIQPPFSKREASVFMEKIRSLRIVSLEKGCSSTSPINRLATLEDGTKVCCRLLQIGNIYSYHLNWLLGLRNVPPITAVKVNLTSEKWKSVHDVAKAAKWHDWMKIVMELFIDNLTEVYNLPYFNDNETSILTVPVAEKLPLTPLARKMMVQWSDMILFDFLTGHTDRKIFNDHKQPVKNLFKTPSSKLVLIDNESTFTRGYQRDMFYDHGYCKATYLFLRRTCAFRQHTIEGILSLDRHSNDSVSPLTVLQNYIKENDPYTYSVIPTWPKQMENIERNMRERIEEIKSRLLKCKSHVL